METQCPGRIANANVDSVLVACSGCGRSVEIFGDEQRVRCRCGEWVFREVLPSCAQWCPAAHQCFGEIVGARQNSRAQRADIEAQEKRLTELREQVAAALENCPRPESRGNANQEHANGETAP